MRRASIALLLASSCTPAGAPPHSPCTPPEKPLVTAQLFFGRDIPDRKPLTDSEWSDFTEQVLVHQFPDGFTTFDGAGHWRDARTQKIAGEATKIVLIVAASADLDQRLAAVIAAYRIRFNQQSVGLIKSSVCGAF